MKDLPQRVFSAIIFGVLLIGGILLGAYTFHILMLLIQSIGIIEYFNLLNHKKGTQTFKVADKALAILWAAFIYIGTVLILQGILLPKFAFIVTVIPIFYIIRELFKESEHPLNNLGANVFGISYLAIPMVSAAIISFPEGNYEPQYVLGILFLTWTYDSFAYFTGSTIGKRPLLARISPKKTVEGVIGGMILTLIAALFFDDLFSILDSYQWVSLALLVVLFGTLGDLAESMFKRSAGVKDSGKIMPGHGGILDRFDAALFAFPVGMLLIVLAFR